MIEEIYEGGYPGMATTLDNTLADDPFIAYDVDELSKRLGVSTRYIYKVLKSGELHGRRIGRRWRVTPANVRVFLDGVSTAA